MNALFEISKVLGKGFTAKATGKTEKNAPIYSLEATYEPAQVAGLKVTLNSECAGTSEGQKETNKVTLLYKKGNVTAEESFSYSKGVVTINSSVALAQAAIRAGVSALMTSVVQGEKKHSLDGYGLKLGYAPSKEFELVAAFDQSTKGKTGSATLFYKKDKIDAAGEISIPIVHGEGLKVPAFTLAIQQQFDAKTTLKAKVGTANKSVAFSIKHQLTDALAVTLASQVACGGKEADACVHQHGCSVNLKL